MPYKMIGYYILKILTWPLSQLPLGFHRAMGNLLGGIVGKVAKYRRDVVMVNIARSFPEKKYDELKEICVKSYKHFCKVLCEAIWFGGSSVKRLSDSRIVRIEDVDTLNGVYDRSKSIIVLLGHSGSWELLGGLKSYLDGDQRIKCAENDISVVYKRLSSPSWDRFMNRNRIHPIVDKAHYDGIVESFDIMRYVYKHRDQKKMYFFITDQSPYSDSSCVKVADFMHQSTWSMNGGPALANLFGLAVMYMSMRRDENDNYVARFIPICEDASQMTDVQILDKYYSLLQEDLEAQPWNYLWTHKRWKK